MADNPNWESDSYRGRAGSREAAGLDTFVQLIHTGSSGSIATGRTILPAWRNRGRNMVEPLTDSIAIAERELSAFRTAVGELYGPEEAQQSTEDWLQELESFDGPSAFTGNSWRPITIAAAVRLASRLQPASIVAKVLP